MLGFIRSERKLCLGGLGYQILLELEQDVRKGFEIRRLRGIWEN